MSSNYSSTAVRPYVSCSDVWSPPSHGFPYHTQGTGNICFQSSAGSGPTEQRATSAVQHLAIINCCRHHHVIDRSLLKGNVTDGLARLRGTWWPDHRCLKVGCSSQWHVFCGSIPRGREVSKATLRPTPKVRKIADFKQTSASYKVTFISKPKSRLKWG